MQKSIGGQKIVGRMAGSLGFGFITHSGKNLFITNAHVAAGFDSRAIGYSVFKEVFGGDVIGKVYRTIEIKPNLVNLIDASVCEPTIPIELFKIYQNFGISFSVSGQAQIRESERFGYFYLSNGVRKDCISPKLQRLNEPIIYGSGKAAFFSNFYRFRIQNAGVNVEHGDSGSILLKKTENGLFACGIVFAGTPETKSVYVQSFSAAINGLGSKGASQSGVPEDISIKWPN